MAGKKIPRTVSEAAALLSRRGASKGGKARAEKLTPEERRAIAKKAIQTRWDRYRAEQAKKQPE